MAGSSHSFDENRAAADAALARFSTAPLPHLIGGESTAGASGETFANASPIDGRHLGDVLHSYAFQKGPLVVLRHAPNNVNRTDDDGTTTYRFGCKNHPGGSLIQQRTAREIADLFETAFATRSPIQLKRR